MTAINASNTPRSLDAIGADLRKLRNIFESGKLLTEANDACEHGEWLPWLETYFDASADTARRHIAAYHLNLKYRMVRDLKVPPTVIYQLADLDFKFDDDSDDLPTIIDALDKATKDKTKLITVAEADQVIDLTALRIDFGDYPTATLHALRNIPPDVEWAEAAGAELKKAQPDSEEAADKIVLVFRRKRLEELFGGVLPDRLGEMALDWLEDVEPERRQQVLAMLNEDASLDWRKVADIIDDDQDEDQDEDDDQDDDQDEEPAPKPKLEPATQETSPAQAAAAEAARCDIGVLSRAEHERLLSVIGDLTAQNNVQKTALAGRDREIADLEGKIKTLNGADLPTLTIDKHVAALVALLKKVTREKQELVVEELCKQFKIDLNKLDLGEAA
jgi:hypothetical protein